MKTSVIDNAISSEHACIKFNAKTGTAVAILCYCCCIHGLAVSVCLNQLSRCYSLGQFYISDGNSNKPSTNGTWMR